MRFGPQQHIRAARLLDDKAKVAIGKQKALLGVLAAAHRIRARQLTDRPDYAPESPRFDRYIDGEALLFFRAAIAHLPWDQFELATLLPALVAHLASLGMDADEIRELKPYVREFTRQLIAGRRARSSMHQAAARYWNAIAESQSLKTEWARQMFPLPQEDMDLALQNEEKRLMRATSNPVLASAYLKIMPLLWESDAISDYLSDHSDLRSAIQPIQSVPEAIAIAQKDFRLTSRELTKLREMLMEPPTPNPGLITANAMISKFKGATFSERLAPAESSSTIEAFFRPSFHAETTLRIVAKSNHTTIELTSAPSMVERRFTQKVIVTPLRAARFWTAVDAMLSNPLEAEHADGSGLDGMSVEVSCRTPVRSANCSVWSPDSRTYAGRLVSLIYDLAWESPFADPAIESLEYLYGYLRDQPPTRIIEGPVTRLRLFGSLTGQHQKAIRQLFIELLRKKTLLIDLTKLDGLATDLHEAFEGLLALHPRLAIATSLNSRRQLRQLDISPHVIFDCVEDALRFLEGRA